MASIITQWKIYTNIDANEIDNWIIKIIKAGIDEQILAVVEYDYDPQDIENMIGVMN
tara:strand:+ start:568 stop:738 length:171 start_codon:yes stop_codon:yes gene_type:complete